MKDKLEYELTLRDLFTKRMDEAIGAVNNLDKRMDSLSKKNKETGMSFMKLGKAIAGAFATQKVIEFGGAVIESLKKYELFMASIKSMLGGNKYAAEALNSQLVQLAKTTPFSLEDVREGAKSLLAYGFQAGKLTDNMRMLGDVSAGVGAPLGDIVYLYGTLRTQGRAFSKDIYQFTGRGIPIVRELAKQFKVTDDKVMDLAKDGKIGFAQVEKAFKAMTSEGGTFFQLMQEQSKTVGGQISNLGDSWEQLKTEIGKSQKGIIAMTTNFLQEFISQLSHAAKMDNFRADIEAKLNPKDRVRETTWYNPATWSWLGLNSADEKTDERYVATNKYGQQRISRNSTEHRYFLNSQGGEGFNDNGTIGTEARLIAFQDKWVSKFDKVSEKNDPLQVATLKSELMKEKLAIRNEQKQMTISSKLSHNELATIDEMILRLGGLSALGKAEAIKTEKADTEKKADLGTGIDTSMHRPQNLYISIDKLVESLSVNSTTVSEGIGKIKDMVAQALIEAVSDVNYIDGK